MLVCLYILEKVEIWSGDTDASQTDRQTTEYRATQLLSSIQFKLSHAIQTKGNVTFFFKRNVNFLTVGGAFATMVEISKIIFPKNHLISQIVKSFSHLRDLVVCVCAIRVEICPVILPKKYKIF